MTTLKYKTNLNCGSCVAAVKPYLDGDPAIHSWSVDTADPNKVLTVEGEGVSPEVVQQHVADAGFKVLDRIETTALTHDTGLNLRGFVDAYQTYNVLARPFPTYGYVYPFIELGLGIAYLVRFAPVMTNLITRVVMLVSIVGVTEALLQKAANSIRLPRYGV